MKFKLYSLFLLITLFSIIAVNAALISVSKGPVLLSKSSTQTYFEVTALNNVSLSMPQQVISINDGKNHFITLNIVPSNVANEQLSTGSKKRFNVTAIIDTGFNNILNIYNFPAINLFAMDPLNSSNNQSESLTFQFQNSFCSNGENGTDLEISGVDLNNKDGDDNEWGPLDEITIDVEVSNVGSDRVKEVNVEIGLIDSNGKNIVKDLEDLDNKRIDLGSINDGNDKTATFTFKVPTDFESASYRLVIKAYSDDKGEKMLCTSSSSELSNTYYESIDGIREEDEDRHVVLNNIMITPATAQCQDKVQVSAEVVNIGDTDYEDQVKVILFNRELGLNLEKVLRENFDQGDSSIVDFEFDVLKNITEKTYTLEFKTYYDYDVDDETYNLVSDQTFTKSFIVSGNCRAEQTTIPSVGISADLDSETPEAVAGKQVIIVVTLRNTGTTETTYDVSISGNSAWSSLVSIDPQRLIISQGQSKDINIVLNIDKDAKGNKELTFRANYAGKTTEQKVALEVVEETKTTVYNLADHIKENWFIYLIVLVNIILIIAIIAVVKRMLSPAREEYQ